MFRKKLTPDIERLVNSRPLSAEDLYPEPEPLDGPPRLHPWPEGKILPPALEDLGLAFADRLRIDPAPVMVALLTASTAPLVGRVWVAPDQDNPTWIEPVALWTAVVMPVSAKKTPVLKLALEPLWEIEGKLQEAYRSAREEHEVEVLRWAAKKEGPRPKPPVQERLLVQDTTKEALQRLLATNPGILAYHDELSGLFQTWRREDRASERAFFLSAYSSSPVSVDRISRDGDYIARPALSLLGFIQPGPFRRVVLEAQGEGDGADGLLQRFIFITAEEREWEDERPKVQPAYLEAYRNLIRRLWEKHRNKSLTLPFTPQAQEFWWKWEGEVERAIRNPDLTDAWRAYLGKRLGLTARVAGVLASLWGEGPISLTTLRRAIAFVLWAEPHAARVWRRAAQGGDPTRILKVAEKLKRGELKTLTPRLLAHRNIAGIATIHEARRVVQALLEAKWLIPGEGPEEYLVNPRVREGGV